ncbi:hypothetical protein SPAN111604_05435 [Sphingomonas antarctica]|uniref:hypothetical protein n=1 Tax=Sphingomonas antarctica TaxID=2040274 RepID=UPI0039E8E9CD
MVALPSVLCSALPLSLEDGFNLAAKAVHHLMMLGGHRDDDQSLIEMIESNITIINKLGPQSHQEPINDHVESDAQCSLIVIGLDR